MYSGQVGCILWCSTEVVVQNWQLCVGLALYYRYSKHRLDTLIYQNRTHVAVFEHPSQHCNEAKVASSSVYLYKYNSNIMELYSVYTDQMLSGGY